MVALGGCAVGRQRRRRRPRGPRICGADRSTRSGTCVARRGLLEPAAVAAGIVIVALAGPKTAPGQSAGVLVREERARQEEALAREEAEKAAKRWREAPDDVDAAQEKLESALERLAKVKQEMRAAEEDLRRYPVPEYLWDECSKGTVMIAVTGSSGVGKSSWINAIRRVRPNDPGAAMTGVTETTKGPQMFRFPSGSALRRAFNRFGRASSRAKEDEKEAVQVHVGDRLLLRGSDDHLNGAEAEVLAGLGDDEWNVKILVDGTTLQVKRHQVAGVLVDCVIWDLPGVGTPTFPQASYLKEMGVRHFDMVVVICASRFTEAELMLIQELRYWKVPFFLVRNKVDADVDAEIEKEMEGSSDPNAKLDEKTRSGIEAQTIGKIKGEFRSAYNLHPVYCISTKRRLLEQFDFAALEKDMETTMKEQRSISSSEMA